MKIMQHVPASNNFILADFLYFKFQSITKLITIPQNFKGVALQHIVFAL